MTSEVPLKWPLDTIYLKKFGYRYFWFVNILQWFKFSHYDWIFKIFWIFLMIQIDKMWLVDVGAVGRFRLGSFRFRRRFFQSKIAAKIGFFQTTWITSKNLSTQGKKLIIWKKGRKILKITFFESKPVNDWLRRGSVWLKILQKG